MRSRRGYLLLLLLAAGVLGIYLGAVAQERPPWPARPIVPPDEPAGVLPSPPTSRKGQEPTPPALPPTPKNSGIKLANFDPETPSAPPPPPGGNFAPAPSLPETPMNVDVGLPEIPLPKNDGPAPPPLFPKESVEPRQITPAAPTKPESPGPPLGPEVPAGPQDPPKVRTETPIPLPAPKDNVGVPGAAKEPVRFTFPSDSPSLQQPVINRDPPKPPAFRVVAQGRRAASPPAAEPLPSSTSLRPGSLFSGAPSLLFVEKRGPSLARVGQVVSYEITVRNEGATPAQQVRVEDEIPRNARLVSAQPQPVVQGDRALWTLESLAPGKDARLRIDLRPIAPGEMVSNTAVLLGSNHVRTIVTASPSQPAGVDLKVQGPERAAVGQMVEFDVRILNPTSQTLTGLALRVRLPSGLITSWGPDIEADLGDMPPAGSKSVKLPAKAVLAGRQVIDVSIVSGTNTLANARAMVVVGQGGLSSRHLGDNRLVLDQESELRMRPRR